MQQMNFYCKCYCLLNMFRGTFMPIIRSSRVSYKWVLPAVFGAWFSSCRYSVECLKQQPANRTHNPQLYTLPTTWKPSTKYGRQQPLVWYSRAPDDGDKGAPKHVEQTIRSAIKIHLLHLVGIYFHIPKINVCEEYNHETNRDLRFEFLAAMIMKL
jgi:hypothetical protein